MSTEEISETTASQSSVSRAPGWYIWDYDRSEVVRGPFPNSGEAGAVRTEMERNGTEERNLWIAYHRTINVWEAERTALDTGGSAATKEVAP